MKVRTVAVVLTAVAAVVVAVMAAVDGTRRPRLELPAASAFPSGPCREMADAVLSLGRFTYEHERAERLPADAYPFLRQRAERLAAVRGKVAGPAPEDAPQPGGASTGGAVTGGETAAAAPGSAGNGASPTAAPSVDAASDPAPWVDPASGTASGSASGSASSTSAADPLEQALSPRIDAVLTAIGFLRLRPGKAYDPALLRDLEAARSDLQRACVSRRD